MYNYATVEEIKAVENALEKSIQAVLTRDIKHVDDFPMIDGFRLQTHPRASNFHPRLVDAEGNIWSHCATSDGSPALRTDGLTEWFWRAAA